MKVLCGLCIDICAWCKDGCPKYSDSILLYFFQGVKLPKVVASTEILASLAIDESAQSAFLPNKGDIPFWKRAWYSCKEHGMSGMLEEMTDDRHNGRSRVNS